MIRLAIIALTIPPISAVAADIRAVPKECRVFAGRIQLPSHLSAEQRRLALSLIDRAMQFAGDPDRRLLRRCRSALREPTASKHRHGIGLARDLKLRGRLPTHA